MANTHLMIVQPQSASLIMTGQKRVEARMGNDRCIPLDRVEPGDTVYIMTPGQHPIGKAIVERVDQYEGLTPTDIDRLHDIYNDLVLDDDASWASNHDAKFAIFITLGRVRMVHDTSLVPSALTESGRGDWRILSDTQAQRRAA
ncbi:MAG: hypothetical protein ACF8MF_00585 [Phycisphaerales bacterium JB052]